MHTKSDPKCPACREGFPGETMKIYIASSWKNQHAVQMLTALLRERGHYILSFVENNHGENPNSSANERRGYSNYTKSVPFEEWCASPDGLRSFDYDTQGATESDLVIYIGPSGTDAWAEVGAAWARGVRVLGLWAKGEQAGLMRRMIEWFEDYRDLIAFVDSRTFRNHLAKRDALPLDVQSALADRLD